MYINPTLLLVMKGVITRIQSHPLGLQCPCRSSLRSLHLSPTLATWNCYPHPTSHFSSRFKSSLLFLSGPHVPRARRSGQITSATVYFHPSYEFEFIGSSICLGEEIQRFSHANNSYLSRIVAILNVL